MWSGGRCKWAEWIPVNDKIEQSSRDISTVVQQGRQHAGVCLECLHDGQDTSLHSIESVVDAQTVTQDLYRFGGLPSSFLPETSLTFFSWRNHNPEVEGACFRDISCCC